MRNFSLALLGLVVLLAAGCRTRAAGYPRDWYAGASFSAVPGVGFAVEGGKVFSKAEKHDWAAEAQFVHHPWDDTDLADDKAGSPGEMSAVRAGLKHTLSPGHKRHVVFRYGFQFYRATGTPGIIDFPGDYFGFYGGFGFETDLSRRWSTGPEVSVAVLEGEGGLPTEVIPTFFWHFIYHF